MKCLIEDKGKGSPREGCIRRALWPTFSRSSDHLPGNPEVEKTLRETSKDFKSGRICNAFKQIERGDLHQFEGCGMIYANYVEKEINWMRQLSIYR